MQTVLQFQNCLIMGQLFYVFFLLAVIEVRAGPTVFPSVQHVMVPGTAVVTSTFPKPLVDCRVRVSDHAYLKFNQVIDFSRRQNSGTSQINGLTATFVGQTANDCGISLHMTQKLNVVLLVEFFGKSEGENWSRGLALVAMAQYPKFAVTMQTNYLIWASLGTNFDLLWKANGALDLCAFILRGEGRKEISPRKSIPRNSRYRAMGYLAHGDCGFSIFGVTASDSGVWWWEGYKNNHFAWQAAVVTVKSAPVGKPVLRVQNASGLRVGDLMEATCHAPPSAPPPKLTWLLDGQVVRDDDGNATLPGDVTKYWPWDPQGAVQTYTRRLSSQDMGKRLECKSVHFAGVDSDGLLLPAHLTVTAESSLIRTDVGHRTEIACIVTGGLTTPVKWHRAGVPVTLSPLVVAGNNGTRHWLQMEDVTPSDITNFTCTAESESQVIQLTGLPSTPTWSEGTSLPQLAWNVETVAELTSCTLKIRRGTGRWQTQEVAGGVRRLNDTWVLVQHEVQETVSGTYTAFLVVRNVHGKSLSSSLHKFVWKATTATPTAPTPATTPSTVPVPTAAPGSGCPALANPFLNPLCKLADTVVDCSVGPVSLGTNAILECREGSMPSEEQHGARNTTCSARGWRPKPLTCVPDCGFRRKGISPRVLDDEETSEGEFPWHVAVFRKKLDSFEPICGGSLITPNFFVSAGDCFWSNTTTINPSLYNAVVGKHTQSWETRDEHEQRVKIKAIHFPGPSADSSTSIALVRLSNPIQITLETNVVCMDWSTEEFQPLITKNIGTIPGWSLTENNEMSSTLRHVDLPFVLSKTCKTAVPWGYKSYSIGDKMCGGYRNRPTGVCQGDLGGGYAFPTNKYVGTRYFLRGVLSMVTRKEGVGKTQCWAEFVASRRFRLMLRGWRVSYPLTIEIDAFFAFLCFSVVFATF